MKKNQTSIFTSTNNILSAAVNKAISKAQTGINTSAMAPAKTSITGAKPYANVVSPVTSTGNRAGQGGQNAYLISKVANETILLNERQTHEAQLVRQLPKDFPIENWEKMPVKAQLFAIQQSGLSNEDQWTLLNATAPFHVLANASPILTPGASNTGSYEKQQPLKSPASVRPNVTSGASNAGSPERRSAILQALDRFDSLSGVTNTGSSKGQQPRFTGQDADTQRAEQRASRKTTDAYNNLNQTLTDDKIDTSSLSGTGYDIYKSTRISMANDAAQGTLDSSKQKEMIKDAQLGIAPGKTAPTSVQDWKQRVSQADTASKEMFDMLESVRVDTDHLTTEQSYIIEKAERQLRDGIINGALDENGVDELIRSICNKVTSETTPPKGVKYVTIMNTGFKEQPVRQMIPALGTLESSGFNTDALEAVRENSDDPYQRAVYNQAIADYNLAIKNGVAVVGGFQSFYDNALKNAYEYSARKFDFVYTNEKGKKVTGTVAMKDLVDPEDNSFGARIARAALKLYGKERYADVFMTDKDGNPFSKKLDCSKLVYYAIYKANPTFAYSTILGTAAEYQMDNLGKRLDPNNVVWRNDGSEDSLDISLLKTGDLLYWANSKGKVVHTAVYLENGLMVEVWDNTRIVELREFTDYGDGSGSTLVQVNRL